MVSINTNLGAYSAQQNLNTANSSVVASTQRLSSGNRIDRAATDVAGLSVGTILATNVSTLKQGLQNAGQAGSLLQVADGGLSNIGDELQRQKALATQAASGSLTKIERGYLDQEFQSLTAEINRTVASTRFGSVNLLDGSLSSQVAAVTATSTSLHAILTSTVIGTVAAAPAAGGIFSINGVNITLASNTDTPDSTTSSGRVIIGSNATGTAANIVRYLNTSNDARLSNFYFYNVGSAISAEWGGGLGSGSVSVGSANVSGTNTFANTATATVATTSAFDSLGRGRTFAVGDIGSANGLLAHGDSNVSEGAGEAIIFGGIGNVVGSATATVAQAVDGFGGFTGQIGDGNIGEFQLTYGNVADTVIATLKVGDITYSSTATLLSVSGNKIWTLNGADANGIATGGSFDLVIRGTTGGGGGVAANSITSQSQADTYAGYLNNAFKGVTFVQNRDITSFNGSGGVVVGGVQIGQLQGLTANLRSSDFSNVQIGGFKITAPAEGQTDAQISVNINGEQYVSYAGITDKINTNTVISLHDLNDPTKAFSIITGTKDTTGATQGGQNGIAFDLSTQANADAVAAALNAGFGIQDGHAALNFQIGSTAKDAIGVEVKAVDSNTLFGGQSLDVTTVDNANAASIILDKAIQYVASVRADVGALQSRITYASANLNTAITNTDAARGQFLDTDVSAESTLFAQAQVKLQASIAVLAQANQLPQNLLKLLG